MHESTIKLVQFCQCLRTRRAVTQMTMARVLPYVIFGLCMVGCIVWDIGAVTVPPLGSSPLPTINLGCEDDTNGTPAQEQKFYNETCHNDTDCYQLKPDSSACLDGRCQCKDGFIPEKQRTTDASKRRLWLCNSPPTKDEPCTTVCQQPYACALVPPPKDLAPTTPGTFDLPVAEQSGNQRFCVCKAPYVYKNWDCVLECKPDEFYADYKCKKRCQNNEIKIDGECRKMGALDQPCQEKRQCITPYARCQDGKCVCNEGYRPSAKKDACVQQAFNCPFGDPLKDKWSSTIIPCSRTKQASNSPPDSAKKPPSSSPTPIVRSKQTLTDHPADPCPDSHFCLFPLGEGETENAIGFCCQKPKLTCPYGEPHPNGTCSTGPYSTSDCPSESHRCQMFSIFGYEGSVCCPLACAYDHIKVNGRCLPSRQYGDKCEVNEQCQGRAVCDNGICACGKGFKPGDDPPTYCKRSCGDLELELNDTCVPLLKLGDHCDSANEQLCPQQSRCSPKQKRCVCNCGYGRLDENTCALHPTCNFTSDTTPIPTPTKEYNITGFTFCQLPDKTRVVANAVRKCPKNQFCADYTSDVGVCCPRPEKPLCQDGSAPKAKCDPNIPKVCGGKGECFRYIPIVAPSDVTDGHICCYHK